MGELPAFPGASGFAAMVTGGRGGAVLKVTSLAADGPGTLQAALNHPGPRIVVFDVSGVIKADIIRIPHGDVTIAGQTAPGGGITLNARLYGAYDHAVGNIVVRHVRVRPTYDGSEGNQFDGIQLARNHHVMLDHVSVGFGVDETIDLYEARDVTVQWCTIESSGTEGHYEGVHNYGLINGPKGGRISVQYNLFAHHKNRCPALATGPAEVRNNVVYDVRHGFVHHNPARGHFNLIGNYFKTGPEDDLHPFFFDDENVSVASDLAYFIDGNWLDGTRSKCAPGSADDPWKQCSYRQPRERSLKVPAPFDFIEGNQGYRAPETMSAKDAYTLVLARAGAFPRDAVALRSVRETKAGTGSWGTRAPSDLMAGLHPRAPLPDGDGDGMPDVWESKRSLDPADGADHNHVMPSGYTAIEEYLNERAAEVAPL